MRTKNKKRLSRKVILLIVAGGIIILGLAGMGTYLVAMNGNLFGWTPFPSATNKDSSSNIDYGPPSEEETGAGDDIKEDVVSPGEPDQKPGTTPEQPNDTGSTVIMSIPYAEQEGNTLRITTLIEKITSSGTCTLTLSRTGFESVVMTADVQAQPSSSTCKGFTVQTTDMAKGNWNLRIDYKDGDITGSVSKDQMII